MQSPDDRSLKYIASVLGATESDMLTPFNSMVRL